MATPAALRKGEDIGPLEAPGTVKACCACGAPAPPGKKLQRCSGCLSVVYCSTECQKAAWPQHKPECSRCKKFDVFAASPLLAAVAFLPRMSTDINMLRYEVQKKELKARELHLHMGNKVGRMRMDTEFDRSGSRVGPSSKQLHHMVQSDGNLEAAVVGAMYGFHCAVQEYNNRRPTKGNSRPATASSSPPQPDYVTLVHGASRITEYGIMLGSTNPDYSLYYHLEDGKKVVQLQDPRNHVWMYFRTERACRLFLDVGSLPYGMGLMLNVIPYLPEGTPESALKHMTPQLGAPASVMDSLESMPLPLGVTVQGGQQQLGSAMAVARRAGYLADRKRFPVSGLPVSDAYPEAAVRDLLKQLRKAPLPPEQEPAAAAAGSPSPAVSAAAAAATAVAMAPPELAAAAVVAATEGTSGGGNKGSKKGGKSSSSSQAAAGGTSVPFRDGPLEDHVEQAMQYFSCAFNNTYAVLEQGTYRRYPASLDGVRCFAPWVDVAALQHNPPRGPQLPPAAAAGAGAGAGRTGSGRRGK